MVSILGLLNNVGLAVGASLPDIKFVIGIQVNDLKRIRMSFVKYK